MLTTLCQACGLCCDGTLFTSVPLTQSDETIDGVEVRSDGSRRLPQRCACLDGTRCTAYARRPTACRRYECLLAVALNADEVPLPAALDIVATAHQRIAAARSSETNAVAARDQYLRFHFTGHSRR